MTPQVSPLLIPMAKATENMNAFRNAPYVGRKIGVFLSKDGGAFVFVYVLTSRSPQNKNRMLVTDGLRLPTAVADPSKESGGVLTVYDAMGVNTTRDCHVVSNGDQTADIIDAFNKPVSVSHETFSHVLGRRFYEPDSLSTPRITAMCIIGRHPRVEMSIINRSYFGSGTDRGHWIFEEFAPGLGWSLQTYGNNSGDPVAFRGSPELLPVMGETADEICAAYHKAVNPDVRVSVAVRVIPLDGGHVETRIMNDFAPTSAPMAEVAA